MTEGQNVTVPPHMTAGGGQVVLGRRGASSRKGEEWARAATGAFFFFSPRARLPTAAVTAAVFTDLVGGTVSDLNVYFFITRGAN